jgi:hypothetical protein
MKCEKCQQERNDMNFILGIVIQVHPHLFILTIHAIQPQLHHILLRVK